MENQIISEEKLLEILPHGSGIDCEWQITVHKNGNITCRNQWHYMNDGGYYDGYYPLAVRIFRHKKSVYHPLKGPNKGKFQVMNVKGDIDFKVYFNEKARVNMYGLGDYLYDTFYYSLQKIITNRGIQIIDKQYIS